MEYLSKSEKETYQIAEELARTISAGAIFALSGNLGSGKTTFVKGLAKALGIESEITSPTFVILKQYSLKKVNNLAGINYLIHADCYRIETAADAQSVGLVDLINNGNNIILLEWSEKVAGLLPERTVYINFEYIDEKTRKITIK